MRIAYEKAIPQSALWRTIISGRGDGHSPGVRRSLCRAVPPLRPDDVLDGWLARRLRAESEFGAKLDSATDVCFLCVSLVRLWPVLRPGVPVLLFAIGVALVRLCAAAAAWVRFGQPGFLHTWGNKLTGLLLFFWPPFQLLTGSGLLLYPLCLAAGVSAVEELLIECTARDWLPDRRSILFSTKQKID